MSRLLRGVCVVIALAMLGAWPATAQDEPQIIRLAGDERIETALEISRDTYPEDGPPADVVVLARSDEFPDALAGGPLATVRNGPLLLTSPDGLDEEVEAEILRVIGAGSTVYLLGGEDALTPAIDARLTELGMEPMRLAGPSRYNTAVAIAREVAPDPAFITVASGNDFPDALIAGSLAVPFEGGVLILSVADRLHQEALAYLAEHDEAIITAVGPDAIAAVPDEHEAFPIDGDNPAERSVVAAQAFYGPLEPAGVALASVERFPDGLTGAAHAFRSGRLPLLLTPSDTLPAAHREYVASLEDRAGEPSYVYGGVDAIEEAVVDQLREALQARGSE